MRALIYYEKMDQGQVRVVEALTKGLAFTGDTPLQWPIQDFHPHQLRTVDLVFAYNIIYYKEVLATCLRLGIDVIYYDKGYVHRGWGRTGKNIYYRFSLNEFHPLHTFQSPPKPPDRWEKLDIALQPYSCEREHIVFAGCSEKFAQNHGFEITSFATKVISQIRQYTKRAIVYRPKKSASPPPPIPGTIYSHNERKIKEELKNAHALVTFSSNAAVDAVFAGVPIYVLGPSIAKPLSGSDLSSIENPYCPTEEKRRQWCYDLAYCQWTLDELANGSAWHHLKNLYENHRAIRC